MNKTFAELFPGGGASAAGGWAMPIFASKSITFTQAGVVVINAVGAGGSGGVGNNTSASAATGGNSAPWGRKKIAVSSGDVLLLTLGAGGPGVTTAITNGNAGGTTTISLNGTPIMTLQGGEGGVFVSGAGLATAQTPVATVTGADFWVPGLQAGTAIWNATSTTCSGGAAVDLLRTGLGRSPNKTTASSALGGTIGTDAGGVGLSWIELAAWGLVITDQTLATSTMGIPGRGGATSPVIAPGAFAGSGNTLPAGYGAGGAGLPLGNANARGGDAYAYVSFTPLE